MKPSEKSPKMTEFLEKSFGRTTAITNNTCTWCGGIATDFKDQLSVKEFTISGFCQKCQDEAFGEPTNV